MNDSYYCSNCGHYVPTRECYVLGNKLKHNCGNCDDQQGDTYNSKEEYDKIQRKKRNIGE